MGKSVSCLSKNTHVWYTAHCPAPALEVSNVHCHIDGDTVVSDVFECSQKFYGGCDECRADSGEYNGTKSVSCLSKNTHVWYTAHCPAPALEVSNVHCHIDGDTVVSDVFECPQKFYGGC